MQDDEQRNKAEERQSEQQEIDNQETDPKQENHQGEQEKQGQRKHSQNEQHNQQVKKEREDEGALKNSMVSVPKSVIKEDLWKAYDFLFPGGKLAKLIKVNNIYKKNIPFREMLDKFKYIEPLPVINLIGAMQKGRGKFYAGIARAAFNTDAVIVDNGLASGIQKFTLRRGVKLIGISPQGEIKFPKINPSQVDPMELANGHTHLFLVNSPDKDLRWGGETSFKMDICLKIAQGKKKMVDIPRCKIVSILMADATFDIIEQVRICVEKQIPIIVVPGSPICDALIKSSTGDDDGPQNNELKDLMDSGHFFYCNSTNSEDIAQLTHLLLSITPW